MDTIKTSIADSTETSKRVSDFIEMGCSQEKFSNEAQTLNSMSSTVRNFGNIGTLCHGPVSSNDSAIYKDFSTTDNSLAAKHYYHRVDEYLKSDVPWTDVNVKAQREKEATVESLQCASAALSSTTGTCKFIKDEKEPSMIMDTPCPNFNLSSEIPTGGTCYDTERKHQRCFGDESASFPPIATVPQRSESCSPHLVNMNQPDQLATAQVRTDSRCGLASKGMLNFDAHAPQQVMIYKNEIPRWSILTSPAESQFWCQSTGVPEDPYPHPAYEGIQSSLLQRNSTPYTAFG